MAGQSGVIDLGSVVGPPGARGRWIFPVSEPVQTAPPEAIVNDFLLNVSSTPLEIGNLTGDIIAPAGAMCQIVSVVPLVVQQMGSLRGPSGAPGLRGERFFPVQTTITTPPVGAIDGDFILNTSIGTINVGNLFNVASGSLCRIMSLSPFNLQVQGNLRGPAGPTGSSSVVMRPRSIASIPEIASPDFHTLASYLSTRPSETRFAGLAIGDYMDVELDPRDFLSPWTMLGSGSTVFGMNTYRFVVVGINTYDIVTGGLYTPRPYDFLIIQPIQCLASGQLFNFAPASGGWTGSLIYTQVVSSWRNLLMAYNITNSGALVNNANIARAQPRVPNTTIITSEDVFMLSDFEVLGRYFYSGTPNDYIDVHLPYFHTTRNRLRLTGTTSRPVWTTGTNGTNFVMLNASAQPLGMSPDSVGGGICLAHAVRVSGL